MLPANVAFHPTALVLAHIEYELHRKFLAGVAACSAGVALPASDDTGRIQLQTSGLRVWAWLETIGIRLDIRDENAQNNIGAAELQLLRASLEGLFGDLDRAGITPRAAALFTTTFNLDLDADIYIARWHVGEMAAELPDGSLVEMLALLLEDLSVVSYEFETMLPNARWRMFHPDMDFAVDKSVVSFWDVVTIANWNIVIDGRAARGYDDAHLPVRLHRPMTLAMALRVASRDIAALPYSTSRVMVLDENQPSFEQQLINRPPDTLSRWPRCNPAFLHFRWDNTLLSVLPVRLTNYPNDALLFHGTLRSSSESIDGGIDFGAARRMALGPGFYCTSNFNEAKSYALARLKTACDAAAFGANQAAAAAAAAGPSSAGQAPAAPAGMLGVDMRKPAGSTDNPLTDLDVATVCVFHLRNAFTVMRVYSIPAGNGHLANRTFRLNDTRTRGNQYVLHGGCAPSLELVQVHDIDARGRVWHTNIGDTAQNVAVGALPTGPFRGVESSTS